VSDAEDAFGTKLFHIGAAGERRYFPSPPPRLPPALAEIAHAVVGLDTRPLKSGRLRQHGEITNGNGLYPSEIAALYDIATGGGGAGQCIAIIEPAGGYDPADVANVCNAMHVPTPQIVDINVGLGRNRPGKDIKADLEVALDIQVVAGVAPEARIAVYFTELNELGLLAGLSEAVHGSTVRPNVIVITWGQPEVFWPTEERIAFDAVLQDAARLGISVITTAGDDLATERMNDGRVHVNYPASSPYVLGCGGTAITLDATRKAIASEFVWNDKNRRGTGGGISDIYRRVPNFQNGATLPVSLNDGKPGRGVPDSQQQLLKSTDTALCLAAPKSSWGAPARWPRYGVHSSPCSTNSADKLSAF
jgi:kumamolisin